jgi:hypothetical protein
MRMLQRIAVALAPAVAVATFTAVVARADIIAWLGAEDPRPGEQAILSGVSCRPEAVAEMDLSLHLASLDPPPPSALIPVDLEYGGVDPVDGEHFFTFTIPNVSPGWYVGQYRCGPGDEWHGAGAGDGAFEIYPRYGIALGPSAPNTDAAASAGTDRPWPPVEVLLALVAVATFGVAIARVGRTGAR